MIRDRALTKCIYENATKLNYKKIVVKVTSISIVKGGFFSSDYANYQVEVDIPGEQDKSRVLR